jgi:type II restriction enzyme
MARRLTAAELVNEIAKLPQNRNYPYISGSNELEIIEVIKPEGPIRLKRNGSSASISREQIARMAFFCTERPNYPLHIDRIFSAGGNTRSAFETLLAYTPNFFVCYPKRVDVYTGEILQDLKHIMWCPDEVHTLGEWQKRDYEELVTEAIDLGVDFERIIIAESDRRDEFESIEAQTTHIQMQIALLEIGRAVNFQTWIAKNDRSIRVGNTTLGQLEGVIQSLDEITIFHKPIMKEKAALIDCIWFSDEGTQIPAVIEIEHSTGITSGLTRMSKLKETLGGISATFTVVAPDQFRGKMISEANDKLFRALNVRFMPYSTVRELYGLVQRYPLMGKVDHQFVQAFMQELPRS